MNKNLAAIVLAATIASNAQANTQDLENLSANNPVITKTVQPTEFSVKDLLLFVACLPVGVVAYGSGINIGQYAARKYICWGDRLLYDKKETAKQ